MPDNHIHPVDCGCTWCAPRHPSEPRIAPSTRAAIIAGAAIASWFGLLALAALIARLLSSLWH